MAHKVMIVDDDRTMNSLLQMLLELDGYSVALAPRGDMVLATALEQRPNVILMDVHLADANGLELLGQIRQQPALQAIPVIMCSGMDLEDECTRAGATAFVLKPYPPEQLAAVLKKLLP